MISNTMASAHLDTEGYEISIPEWPGRQTDIEYLTQLATFVELVKTCFLEVLEKNAVPVEPENTTTHYFLMHPHDEAQPPVSSETAKAVSEIIAEEEYDFPMFDIIEDDLPSRIDRFEAEHPEWVPSPDIEWLEPMPDTEEDTKERAILDDMKKTDDAAWIEAATEEELASQSSDSRDLEDFFDEDDNPYYW